MSIKNYKDMIVWQKSMALVEKIFINTELLPKSQTYGLALQMQRAAVSIPSNIAEGQERNSTKEFIHFLLIAQGSRAELETQLLICERLNYIPGEIIAELINLCDEIGRMLNSIIYKLQSRI